MRLSQPSEEKEKREKEKRREEREKQKSGDSEEREREREREEGEEEEERRMTSAARPTWAPAKGSEDQGGTRMFGPRSSYSSKDAPAHTKLKYREVGQEGPLAAKNTRDLKRELLQKEAKHFKVSHFLSRRGAARRGFLSPSEETSSQTLHTFPTCLRERERERERERDMRDFDRVLIPFLSL